MLLGRLDDAGRLRYIGRSTELSAPAARDLAAHLAPAGPRTPLAGRAFSAGWGTRDPLDVTLVAPDLAAQDTPAFGAGNQPAAG